MESNLLLGRPLTTASSCLGTKPTGRFTHLFNGLRERSNVLKPGHIVEISKQWFDKSYWTKVNTIEAWAFATKIAIIFPGLLLGKQWWWLYIFALASSLALILTSTIKTLPTIIWFNMAWVVLASVSIIKHFA